MHVRCIKQHCVLAGKARLGRDSGSGGGCGKSVASAVPDTGGGLHGRLNGRRCKVGQQLQHASPNHKCCHHIWCCCLVAAASAAAAAAGAAVLLQLLLLLLPLLLLLLLLPLLLLLLQCLHCCCCCPLPEVYPAGACPCASSSSCCVSGCLQPEHQRDAVCQLRSPCCTTLNLNITQRADSAWVSSICCAWHVLTTHVSRLGCCSAFTTCVTTRLWVHLQGQQAA